MDFKAISEAGKLYKSIALLCGDVGVEYLPQNRDGKAIPLKDMFRIDTALFMMFLSSTDGSLSRSEVELMDAVTGHNTDPKVLAALIKEHKLNSLKSGVRTPKSLKAAVSYGKEKQDMSLAEDMIKFYRLFGQLLINSYNGAEKAEEAGLDLYLSNLEKYMNNNI